ncbi:LamG domain-containing protein [Micromonospora sp. NPDC048930]|uniref:LamG domain-containing protein n=1 Tax=Micromonospora sp. NPDC048930 TaxID=3364261 RepID=UPI00371D0FDF
MWTHLAGVYDSAAHQLKLYVNGTPESTVSGSIPAATGPLRIGASAGLFWSGSLAELQVWNRVLSTTEVAGLCDPLTVGRSLNGTSTRLVRARPPTPPACTTT